MLGYENTYNTVLAVQYTNAYFYKYCNYSINRLYTLISAEYGFL